MMGLIDRLRESYRNGREERRLLRKKFNYHAIRGDLFPDTEVVDDRIVRIHQQLDTIPEPRGFLETIAYIFGST